jgi:type I restriction enzyme M protein
MEDQELQEASKDTRTRALTVAGILKGSEYSLTLFSTKEVAALELFERNGKPYLNCLGTLKPRPAKPEEIVRQLISKS